MYILRLEYQVGVGQRGAFEASQTQLYDLVSKQPGIVRSTLFNSLAYPGKYTRISIWESRGALLDFWKSAESGSLGQAPAAPVAPSAPMQAFEEVELVRQIESYPFSAQAEISIAAAQGQAYEQSRKEWLALIRREGRGVAFTGLARQAGGGGHYLLALGFLSPEDARATLTSPAITEFQQAHPLSAFGGSFTSQEGYAIVQVAVPARVAAS
jgi:quinol monooxygenase YgiN